MFTDLSPWQKASAFYALALSLCAGLCVLMRNSGEPAAVAAMVTPFVAVLLMQLVVTRDGWTRAGWSGLGLGRSGLRYWPVALLVPVLVMAGSEFVVLLTGLTSAGGPAVPGALDVAANLTAAFVILVGFCFFEEIGWRGYLQPLVGRGLRPGLVVGFLHGLWHMPIVFIVAGAYLTDGNRWLTVPVFMALLTVAGSIYGWLRDRTGSVWPAVLAHAAFNLVVDLPSEFFVSAQPERVALIGRETGIATLAMLILAAVVLCTRAPARDRDLDDEAIACPQTVPV